jgi:hypothetical protein
LSTYTADFGPDLEFLDPGISVRDLIAEIGEAFELKRGPRWMFGLRMKPAAVT